VGGICITNEIGEMCLQGSGWEAQRDETIGKT
jgi:hypothetical protein